MIYPEFTHKGLEITGVKFTPDVIAIGEQVSFDITIRNSSGANITGCFVEAQLTGTSSSFGGDGIAKVYPYVTLYGKSIAERAPITWRNGTEYTFSGSAVYDDPDLYRSEYILPYASLRLTVVANEAVFGGGNSNYTAWPPTDFASGGCMKVLSKRDNPVLLFDAERFPDDEAARLKANIKLNGDSLPGEMDSHGYTAALYKRPEIAAPGADEQIGLNCFIGDIINGIVDDMSVIGDEFPNTSGWILTMLITNGYESASAAVSIPRAFANMHLSGKTTGGVAFGGFSKSEEGNPMAEFHYPIHAYKKIHAHDGIEGVGFTYPQTNSNYADPSTGGEQLTGDYWIDGKPIYRRVAQGYLGTTGTIHFQTIGPMGDLIRMYGYGRIRNNSSNAWIIPLNASTGVVTCRCWVNDYKSGQIWGQVSPAGMEILAVIEFTKPD